MKTRSRWNALPALSLSNRPSTRFFSACARPKRVGGNALHLLALLALAVAPLRADVVQSAMVAPGSEVTIKVSTPTTTVPRFGFAPMRITIENTAAQERTWRASFQVGMRGQFPGFSNTTRAFTVPAGQTRETWVFVPVAEPSSNAGTVASPGSAAAMPTPPITRTTRPARGAPAGPPPVVTIAQTPIGTKVSTTRGTGPTAFTMEQEIDSTTGAMTTSYLMPPGRYTPPPTSRQAAQPGTEVTFIIDQTYGTVRTTVRPLPDRSAPAKIVIIASPQAGSAAGATVVSATGGLAMPIVVGGTTQPAMLVVEFSGPGVVANNRLQFSSPPNVQMRPFAVSASLEPVVRSQLAIVARGTPNLSAVTPAQLPADWRVWSSFAGVVLTTDEYASLDAGRRAALRGWIGLGGRLWLSPLVAGESRLEKLGAGQIVTLADPIGGDGTPASAGTGAATIDQRTIDLWVSTVAIYAATPGLPNTTDLILEKTPLGEAVQEAPRNNTWLAVFLVAFAAVVGPLNLFVFAPPAKRYRLFLTTPLIALAAAIILAVTILFQDGLGGDGARRALVVLLPGENQAAVFQEQASVTGFLARRTFPIADDTHLAVIPIDNPDPRMGYAMMMGNATDLARAEGRAGGDWFRSRGRQAQLLERLVPTRGRVERAGTAPDGAPMVQSSLGTTLRDFVYIDDDGKFWTAADLPPGKRVALKFGDSSVGTLVAGGSRRFADVIGAATPRHAGHWRAHGGATDLAPIATLDSVRWAASDVLFTGVLEGGTEAKR